MKLVRVPAATLGILLLARAIWAQTPASSTVQLKVLLNLDYVDGEPLPQPPNQGFGIRRTRLFAQLIPATGLGFRIQLEPSALANGPLSAPPLRGAPLIEAYLDYTFSNHLLIRAGQQRVPFGLNSYQAPPSSPMIEFPQFTRYVVQRVDAFRDIGITAGGRTAGLEYAAGVFNGAGPNATADNDSTRDVAARVAYAIFPGVQLGASAWRGRTGNLYTRTAGGAPVKGWYDNADFRRFDAELRVARGPLDVLTEYGSERLSYNARAQNATPNQQRLRRNGYSIASALRLGVLTPTLKRLQVAARYDAWDPNREVADDRIREYAVGASYYLLNNVQKPDARFGRALNDVQRDSRIMVFWELARPQTSGLTPRPGVAPAHDSQRLRVRWELFY